MPDDRAPISADDSTQPLEPCPWCSMPLYIRHGVNAYGVCRTEGCFGTRMPVVSFGDPRMVAAWNARTPSPSWDEAIEASDKALSGCLAEAKYEKPGPTDTPVADQILDAIMIGIEEYSAMASERIRALKRNPA